MHTIATRETNRRHARLAKWIKAGYSNDLILGWLTNGPNQREATLVELTEVRARMTEARARRLQRNQPGATTLLALFIRIR